MQAAIRRRLENKPKLSAQAVDDLMVEGDRVVVPSHRWASASRSRGRVTAGTFLDGKIHVGLQNYGPAGDPRPSACRHG